MYEFLVCLRSLKRDYVPLRHSVTCHFKETRCIGHGLKKMQFESFDFGLVWCYACLGLNAVADSYRLKEIILISMVSIKIVIILS